MHAVVGYTVPLHNTCGHRRREMGLISLCVMHALKQEWKAVCWLMWLQDRCALVSLQCTECVSSECSRAHVVRACLRQWTQLNNLHLLVSHMTTPTLRTDVILNKTHSLSLQSSVSTTSSHPPLPSTLLHTRHKVPDHTSTADRDAGQTAHTE